jgi:hypothetical protein
MENYKFSIPVKVSYIADESTISIENIDDLEEVQEKYGADLEFIIDEFEYRLDIEKDNTEEEEDEHFGMSEDDIFNDVISDNWTDIVKKLNKEYRLDDLTDENVKKIFSITKEHFNKNVTTFNHDDENLDYTIISADLVEFDKNKNEFIIEINVDKKLKKEEIDLVKNWIEYITSEDWGLRFSKTDLSDKLEIEDVYVYLIPWSLKREIKYIEE